MNERFEMLYRKNYARVYRYFRACRLADEDAQDLAQETFKRIYENLGSYRSESERSYVETVARNVLFNMIRARKTLKRTGENVHLDDPATTLEVEAPAEPDYADRQETALRRAKLWAAIAALPQGQRDAVELWIGDQKYEAIARTLGITLDAVKSRIRDARKTLKERLGDAFPEDE